MTPVQSALPPSCWIVVFLSLLGLVWSTEAPVCLLGDSYCNLEQCGLYLAPSVHNPDKLNSYSGVAIPSGATVLPKTAELFLSMTDANQNEYSPWHDVSWRHTFLPPDFLNSENHYLHELVLSGLGALSECGASMPNIDVWRSVHIEKEEGVSRSQSTAGSFSYRTQVHGTALRDILPGDPLLIDCKQETSTHYDEEIRMGEIPAYPSLSTLAQDGVCLDTLEVKGSTLSMDIGRGAFSKRFVARDDVIVTSPVLHFDRSQLEIPHQQYREKHFIPFRRPHGIEYTENVTGYQLLRNYVYGRPDSNVMLLPLAPGVNFINHRSDKDKVNARIQWSEKIGNSQYLMEEYPLMELFDIGFGEDGYLAFDFVAIRDIQPGEEIFLDYGDEWQRAWEIHVMSWKPEDGHEGYMSAAEYRKRHRDVPTPTVSEQTSLPPNLHTVCNFNYNNRAEQPNAAAHWTKGTEKSCFRPCELLEREIIDEGVVYTATLYSMESVLEPIEVCGKIPDNGVRVTGIPSSAVQVVDKPYTKDQYMPRAFRHEIGVPMDMYPRHWLLSDEKPQGDFIASPLPPGKMSPIRWRDSAEVVSPWAFRVGVPKSVRKVLLEYCKKMGIIDIFRHVTINGNALQADQNGYISLDNMLWYLQRPGPQWRSNLHWLSPGDNQAHENYLQALSVAGFDQVLDGIASYLDMEGLVAFHVTFIAVSQCTLGFLHHDVYWTDAKTYNVIIPLILANETGPELDLCAGSSFDEGDDEEEEVVGRYRYEYEVASMMGDGAVHATSAVDYRGGKEMRLAATVYIADVNEDNVDSILSEYTQVYPPDDRDLLLSWAGRHWKKDDSRRKLPLPPENHILMRDLFT